MPCQLPLTEVGWSCWQLSDASLCNSFPLPGAACRPITYIVTQQPIGQEEGSSTELVQQWWSYTFRGIWEAQRCYSQVSDLEVLKSCGTLLLFPAFWYLDLIERVPVLGDFTLKFVTLRKPWRVGSGASLGDRYSWSRTKFEFSAPKWPCMSEA